jgi:uncharacterized protein (TIGR02117 family)
MKAICDANSSEPARGAIRWAAIALLGCIGMYAAACAVLGLVAVNRDVRPAEAGVTIYIRSNSIHTDIAVPVQTELHDWTEEFPRPMDAATAPFILFGWGDRGFYLETPQWRDLRFGVAARALLGIGRTAMHVDFSGLPQTASGDVPIRLSEASYKRLVSAIQVSFARGDDQKAVRIGTASYTGRDAFYEARGAYSAIYTCNDWVRWTLTQAGVRMPVWSPFDWAIFHHARRNEVN